MTGLDGLGMDVQTALQDVVGKWEGNGIIFPDGNKRLGMRRKQPKQRTTFREDHRIR